MNFDTVTSIDNIIAQYSKTLPQTPDNLNNDQETVSLSYSLKQKLQVSNNFESNDNEQMSSPASIRSRVLDESTQDVTNALQDEQSFVKLKSPRTTSAKVQYKQQMERKQKSQDVNLSRKLCDPETQRKCVVADQYFIEYYYDLLTYLHDRKLRLQEWKEEARQKHWDSIEFQKQWKSHTLKESALLRLRRQKPSFKSFEIIRQIGQGGYGRVYLAKLKNQNLIHLNQSETNQSVIALKVMSKQLLDKMGETSHIESERDVLSQTLNQEWLVKMFYSFQDVNNVYLAMEYVPGGDLRTFLNNSGILRESDAKFYVAEMALAINQLHLLGYIHRDLKPENFLIDIEGHLKLTDFGLCSGGTFGLEKLESIRGKIEALKDAKVAHYSSIFKRTYFQQNSQQGQFRAYSLVGSPDYMAPEVLVNSQNNAASSQSAFIQGYDLSVDYWSLGCIMFEFLAGYPPFAAPTMEEVWLNLYHWQEALQRPEFDLEGEDAEFNLSDESWDLITRLIALKHSRISTLFEISNHPWFSDFNDKLQVNEQQSMQNVQIKVQRKPIPKAKAPPTETWSQIKQLTRLGVIKSPFVPKLKSELDFSHFDDFTDPKQMEIYKEVYQRQESVRPGGSTDIMESTQSPIQGKIKNSFLGFTFLTRRYIEFDDLQLPQQQSSELQKGILSRFQRKNHLQMEE